MDVAAASQLSPPVRPRPGSRRRPTRRERHITRRLARGHRDAIAELQDEYGRSLLGFLADFLGDRGAAEDVYQQVLVEAWRRGSAYDPARSSLLGWLLMIARSRAIDTLRKRVPKPVDPAEMPVIPADDQQEALIERWRVAQLLSRIPADEARVLKLRFYAGLSQREIALTTGTALGTVKLRMVQGLARLRDMLEAEGTR